MKVRCVRLHDSGEIPAQTSRWCTIGKIYDVLMILIEGGQAQLRLISDEREVPALFPLTDFEIVDGSLPANWIIAATTAGGGVALTPERWADVGFWEAFFNREPDALATFEQERRFLSPSVRS